MLQNDFGNKLKKLRQENHMTQKQLGDKLNVTYQAVSKWENGKNLPDTLIIKEIAQLFCIDINELLDIQNIPLKVSSKKPKFIFIATIILVVSILTFFVIMIINNQKNHDDFKMKTVSTTCDNFKLSGSIAYNENKTSIYISEINYCGLNEDKEYKKITCTLYEKVGNEEKAIRRCEEKGQITLKDYLKELKFYVDNYATTCKDYSENDLYIRINLISSNEETLTYTIPLSLQDNCFHELN